jgi:hypothetical protein
MTAKQIKEYCETLRVMEHGSETTAELIEWLLDRLLDARVSHTWMLTDIVHRNGCHPKSPRLQGAESVQGILEGL